MLALVAAGLVASNSAAGILTIGLLGALVGGFLGLLYGMYFSYKKPGATIPKTKAPEGNNREVKVQLKKEDLAIHKNRVRTGEVSVRKEVLTENKTIVVPVTREELVIENKVLGTKNQQEQKKQVFRIPLRREKIEIFKYPVDLEHVSIFKRKLMKNHRIKESIKKEKVKLDIARNLETKVKEVTKYNIGTSDLAKLHNHQK